MERDPTYRTGRGAMTTDGGVEAGEDVHTGEKRTREGIENAASALGRTVAFLAESGVLFVAFALIWIAVGVALIASPETVDAVWQGVRGLPLLVEGVVWVFFLPVMIGLWIWETAWPLIVRLILVIGVAGWNLLVFPKPWD